MINFFRKRTYKYEVAICGIVKDETPYLIEWIEYHLKIGVAHFFIYDNESRIPVADTLRQFVEKGLVTVVEVKGKNQQVSVYQQCLKQYGKSCNWIAFIDIDEFIVPKNSNGSLPQLLVDYKAYGGLAINWLVFGSNGHKEKQTSQIKSYTKRSEESHLQNTHYKSIVQPRYVKRSLNPHKFSYRIGKYCVTENFEKIKKKLSLRHSSSRIQLNHYNLRSLEEFKEKIERGRADTLDPKEMRTMQFFLDIDACSNIVTDTVIIELQKHLG